jgi:hypothetical protein
MLSKMIASTAGAGLCISLTTDGDVRGQQVLIQLFMPPFFQ